MNRLYRRWRTLFLVLGGGLLRFLIWQLGIQTVVGHIAPIGWRILPVLAVSMLWKCVNTVAWMLAFPPDTAQAGFWRLFRANLMGDVVNSLLPTANLGGELAKPYLLRSRLPVSKSLSAVVANKTMELLSGLVFATVGVAVALFRLPLEGWVRAGLVAAVGVGGTAIGLACFVQRRRPLTRLLGILDRLGVSCRLPGLQQGTAARVGRPVGILRGVQGSVLGVSGAAVRQLGPGDAGDISHCPFNGDGDFSGHGLFAGGRASGDRCGVFLCAGECGGTFEAGHAYLFLLLGMNPAAGLSVALVKRFRKFSWLALGVVLLYTHIAFEGGGQGSIRTVRRPVWWRSGEQFASRRPG